MIIDYPDYAIDCLKTIEQHGFEAWFVGGSVRDSILRREFYDIDITTNALPEEIEGIFENTVPTGKKHGTITVIIDSKPIEVTTYRSECGYNDNRHPDDIIFEKHISVDLSRRDFTINAFAYHPKRDLLDLFGGMNDLKNGRIKTVGDARMRFTEDSLRILRAFRFASVLGFEIDEETEKAAFSCGNLLCNLSGERILGELKKLSEGKNPNIIAPFIANGYLKHFGILGIECIINNLTTVKSLYRTAAMISLTIHDLSLLKFKLKADNYLLEQIDTMDTICSLPVPKSSIDLKLLLNQIGKKNLELYTEYCKIIYSDRDFKETMLLLDKVLKNDEPFCIEDLKINGNVLKSIGINGKKIGEALNMLTIEVIKNPSENTEESLINLVNRIM